MRLPQLNVAVFHTWPVNGTSELELLPNTAVNPNGFDFACLITTVAFAVVVFPFASTLNRTGYSPPTRRSVTNVTARG